VPDPDPPAAAPPVARVAQGPPELATVAACWPAVIDLVRKDNQMLAALLADARPVALHDQDVTVAFPAGKAFLKRKAEQDEHRRVAIDAVKSVTGQRMALRFELRELAADEEQNREQTLSGEELVRRFMEEFAAEEILDEDEHDQREAHR
jgi:hypothetical protein